MKTLILSAAVLLCGCAAVPEGATMSEEEREACKAEGCTVWTQQELQQVFMQGVKRGYAAGAKSL